MPNVCFTGRGYRGDTFVTRDVWEANARSAAFTVVDEVTYSTNYLVASRSDTSKAKEARRYGEMGYNVRVVTYGEWLDIVQRQTGISTPEYSIGFFRGQFIAMSGETVLARRDTMDAARAVIVQFASERNIRQPPIDITLVAQREHERRGSTSRLASSMQTLAGYATPAPIYQSPRTRSGPIPAGVMWDEEDQCFRGAMNYALPESTYEGWYERRAEFPRFNDRVRSERHTPPAPPSREPERNITPIAPLKRAINWED